MGDSQQVFVCLLHKCTVCNPNPHTCTLSSSNERISLSGTSHLCHVLSAHLKKPEDSFGLTGLSPGCCID